MATLVEIATLRRLTNQTDDTEGYTDDLLNELIDNTGSVDAAAAQVWRELAAEYATMVDITESGSARKLSDLQTHAHAMVELFEKRAVVTMEESSGTVISHITRD